MLINVLQPEECRIAIVEDGVLEELYIERTSQESYVGNIYKGRIVNIEPSIQAAFVDFGIGRNGFLHVSDVDPAYYKHLLSREDLAAYEAEMEREYGPAASSERSSRGRRNGGRGSAPRELTAWLEPQTPPAASAAEASEEFVEDAEFASGIADEAIVTEPKPELPSEAGSPDRLTAPEETPEAQLASEAEDGLPQGEPGGEENGFATGLLEGPVAEATPRAPQHLRESAATAPPPAAAAKPSLTSAPPVEDDEFSAGIVEESAALPRTERADEPEIPTAEDVVTQDTATESTDAGNAGIDALEGGDPIPPIDTSETNSAEPVEATKKSRGRKGKTKTEEPAEAIEAVKPRSRRKKKDETDDNPDDKPRYMTGAERRTTPVDEPEIQPFFETNTADFDPEGPNDRFIEPAPPSASESSEPTEEHLERFVGDPETAEAAEEEARQIAHEAETEIQPDEGEEVPDIPGRGFNDNFDTGRRERPDRGRSRAGRGRDRGGRSPRSGGFKNGGPKGGRDRGLPKPPIQEIFKRGQEVIVQVIKEAVGTKGPTLSTYISIAGRYLVLMPSLNRVGVSRKIEDHDARRRLREIMNTLSPPKGVGFIVRTAAVDRDAKELQNDLAYLLRLWQVVVKRLKRHSSPVEIYRESDMITRTIRDIFTADIDTIWVDEEKAFAHASEFLQIVMPKFASRIKFFNHTEPLFHRYGIEEEISKIYQKRIEMPLGGSLVIEQTEALVAIDVNSGNFRADNNAEETAFQMNLHAAREIARQLRLRDLGGVIVNDFIDMKSEVHRRKVEDAFREALRRDRARTKILRISQFGLIEMTRQRIRPSLKRSLFQDCPHCNGNGFIKTSESLAIEVMRLLQLAAHRAPAIQVVQVTCHPDVAHYLLNKRRKDITALEERGKLEVTITGQPGVPPETLQTKCFDHNGNEVRLIPAVAPPKLTAGRVPRDQRNRRDDRRYPQPLD
ncbi:MAG: Rne/Rng family ribonuclease [Gemmataceae bacterium]|nr:Rne/Rng family ribonuclease [Gemmata sp.]MDW8196725.1 Rne/Rng family ribonuclease [Gemmataceae bacterium]